MTLDELRRLDPKKIGSWPILPKLGVLILVLVSIVFDELLDIVKMPVTASCQGETPEQYE